MFLQTSTQKNLKYREKKMGGIECEKTGNLAFASGLVGVFQDEIKTEGSRVLKCHSSKFCSDHLVVEEDQHAVRQTDEHDGNVRNVFS